MGQNQRAVALLDPLRTWRECGLHYLIAPPGSESDSAAPSIPPSSSKASPEAVAAVPPETAIWPEPWASQLSTIPSTPLSVWTYMELGLDLGGRPDTKRKQLLASLIECLAWPRGSITFWPCSHIQENNLTPRPDLYWEGIRRIQPYFCVVFGQEAFTTLLPQNSYRHGFLTREKVRILSLPGLQEMLPDVKPVKKLVWEFLKGLPAMR